MQSSKNFMQERKTLLQSGSQKATIAIPGEMHNIQEIEGTQFQDIKMQLEKLEFKHFRYVGDGGSSFYKAFAIAILERTACLKEESVQFYQEFQQKWKAHLDLPSRLETRFTTLKRALSQPNETLARKNFYQDFYKFGLEDSYFIKKIVKFLRVLITSFIQKRSNEIINGKPLIEHITITDNFKSLSKFQREIIDNEHAEPSSSILLILASIFTIPVSLLNVEMIRAHELQQTKESPCYFDPQRYCAEFCQFNKQHTITFLRAEQSYYILYKSKQSIQLMRDSFKIARDTLAEHSQATTDNSTHSEALKIITLGCGHTFTRGQIMSYLRRNFPEKPKDFYDFED